MVWDETAILRAVNDLPVSLRNRFKALREGLSAEDAWERIAEETPDTVACPTCDGLFDPFNEFKACDTCGEASCEECVKVMEISRNPDDPESHQECPGCFEPRVESVGFDYPF